MTRHANETRLRTRAARGAVALALCLTATASGAAIVEGRTSDGHRYLSGGVGTEEVDALRAQAAAYSLQLVLAARGGAYLAGTRVKIVAPDRAVVLETTLDGPWLLVDLPAGRYVLQAAQGGRVVERAVVIAPGKPQRLTLHFDVPVDVDPTSGAEDAAPPATPR